MIRGEEEEEEEEGGSTNVLDNETEKQQGCNTSQDQVEWLTDEVKKKTKKKNTTFLTDCLQLIPAAQCYEFSLLIYRRREYTQTERMLNAFDGVSPL